MRTLTHLCLLFLFAWGVRAQPTYVTFAPPGVVGGTPGTAGTFPTGINTGGTVAGYFSGASELWNGFIRASDGTFTIVNAPGAGTVGGSGTLVLGINASGTTTGYYIDGENYGFVRTADGTFTEFQAPGAEYCIGTQGTLSEAINDAGDVTGDHADSSCFVKGFVRTSAGAIITFAAPSAGTGTGSGTFPGSISDAGSVTGYYIDAAASTTVLCAAPRARLPPSTLPAPARSPARELWANPSTVRVRLPEILRCE